MKKALLALLLVTATLSASAGQLTLTNTTIDTLEHTGLLTLKNVKIPGSLSGSGSLSAANCTFGSITWTGTSHLINCRITGTALFTGALLAGQTTFEHNVNVTSNTIEIDGGVIKGDLIIQPIANTTQEQTVALSGAALVKGDIRFLSGNGVLKKTGRAEVQGQVIGLKE